jgi:ribonuclease HII
MGYAVPEHCRALTALGPTVHHRRSFAPVLAAYNEREEAAGGVGVDVAHDLLAR